jgi:predicted TIM-barrel fold metal-dependent hydrolase
MNRTGIDKAVICPIGKALVTEIAEGNNRIASMVKKHPDRLVGFATASPWHEEAAIAELDRCVDMGLKGLKLHPDLQGFVASDELAQPLVRRAGELKIPVYVHSGSSPNSQPMEIGEMARACPETIVIMGHMGYSVYYLDAIPPAKHFQNIVLETSRNALTWIIEDAAKTIGPDRIVFGTDQPYSKAELELARIKSLTLDTETRDKILGGNIKRILHEA